MKTARWLVLRSKLVVDAEGYRLRRDRVRWPDGTEIDYYVSLRPDVVVICGLTDRREILLVEQYKHAVRERTLELPAGTLGTAERPLTGAKRELLEETGYRARGWAKVACLLDDSSKNDNRVHVFVATGARWDRDPPLEAGERAAGLRSRTCPFDEAMELVRAGRISSQSSVAALLACADFIGRKARRRG